MWVKLPVTLDMDTQFLNVQIFIILHERSNLQVTTNIQISYTNDTTSFHCYIHVITSFKTLIN